jgi:DNA-binding transcriptional ArsR family regulator
MNTLAFSALAEPNRLRIVELLRGGPASVGDIAKQLLLRQPLVSNHLRVLNKAGFVAARPVAQRRVYELQAKPFEELDTWVETFNQHWQNRLDVFEDRLHGLKAEAEKTQHNFRQ